MERASYLRQPGIIIPRANSWPATRTVSILLVICFAAMAPRPVWAQLSTGSINGTVRDSSGSTIPETKVVLRNVDTAVERTTATNVAGAYVFLNVAPGVYTLEVTRAGFNSERISAFRLEVNQTATFDATLRVGAVQESVVVEALGAAVQSSTSELGAVVTTQQVVDLPLNGRNFTQLLSLTPGVAPISVAQNSGGAHSRPVGQFAFPA